MRRRSEAERLRLCILLRMQARVDLAVADNHRGKQQSERCRAHADGPRQSDRFNHDVAQAGDLVCLDNLHYDGRARRLHDSIVLQP